MFYYNYKIFRFLLFEIKAFFCITNIQIILEKKERERINNSYNYIDDFTIKIKTKQQL